MGREARCLVTANGDAAESTVLLEGDEVIVRGALRRRIAFSAITDVAVARGTLTLHHAGGTTALALGAAAADWAARIRSPKSRIDKLAVPPGATVSLIGLRDPALIDELAARDATVIRGRVRPTSDVVFLGVERDADLPRIAAVAQQMPPAAALWVVHPKGKGGVPDTAIFAAGKSAGLVAVKVARYSETHTAERLVRPRSATARPRG